jgi:hypothetical protein
MFQNTEANEGWNRQELHDRRENIEKMKDLPTFHKKL